MLYADVVSELEWIEATLRDLHCIMEGLPDILKLGWTFDEPMDEVRLAVMGMQRANLAITAVSIRFALVSFNKSLTKDRPTTRRNSNKARCRLMLSVRSWERKHMRPYHVSVWTI
jgi:hypothetical protein